MPRIQQLPPLVVAKIAAGEVIERPASVLKELLENSVDAGSTRIDIEAEEGGTELIRVVDDGGGIEPADLQLAFASHATSKLRDAEELFQIGSLGFRGEALASIGGVAQVTLQSRPSDQASGAEITCNGGELSPIRIWNGSHGTRMEVRHLFFNTPVRRKFLRKIPTEFGHLSETFTRLALAHPHLHLTLKHNGKMVYEVPASLPLKDRLGLFFGDEVRDALYPIEVTQGPARLSGFVADPRIERGNAKHQYLFLNGRWIRDRSLSHALQEGFRGLLLTGRYAVAFLFLELPPDLVDVNVHPTKSEVRFRDGQAVYHLVLGAVRNRLSEANLTARLQPTTSYETRILPTPMASFSLNPISPQATPPTLLAPSPPVAEPSPLASPAAIEQAFNANGTNGPVSATPQTAKAFQLYNAYLVLETGEGLLVIDQHALHERILFEQIKRRLKSGELEAQKLLIPEPVELSAEQAALVLEARLALAELGLGVEDFGGGTVLISSYPAILGHRPPQSILKFVVDHLTTKDRVPPREVLLNNLMSLMACHAAVRAGDPLNQEEIAALVEQRAQTDDSHHCPHGRPTALLFTRQDLDRQFRRT